MSHTQSYTVRIGERGRLVLPADLRRRAGFEDGQELVLRYSDGVIQLATREQLARAGRGMFSHAGGDRDLVGELLSERRREAERDRHPA